METALYYAKKCCETMMRKFSASDLPPKGKFHYHQGVFLSGMQNVYEVCKEQRYYDYIKDWVNSIIYEDGSINSFDKNMLDDIQPGILLFELYKTTKDERYKIALDTLMPILKDWKCNEYGGFWHKEYHPNQMWLDGLYMAGPLEAQYSATFGETCYLETAINQIILMRDHIQDPESKLLYHAWDPTYEVEWADPETGLSAEFWGRALGWYVVAILDILEFVPESHPKRQTIIDIELEVLKALAKYQDSETGAWHQVVDKGDCEGNWLESSCTCLFSYAMAKAVRMGLANKKYLDIAIRGFEGVINNFVEVDGDDLLLSGVCVGTDVSTYEEYITRPTVINDLHGSGAFLLMCAEIARHS